MSDQKTFIYDGKEPIRIDVFLSDIMGISRSAAARLTEQGMVQADGREVAKNFKLSSGCCIVVEPEECVESEAAPENIPIDIIYEDADVLVVNKPKGMVVHPAPGNPSGTLVNALLYHCGESLSGIGGVIRPGIVHRIDKDTSGLLMVAKNDAAHIALSEQIKDHSFIREYEAVVHGIPKNREATINAPIGRHP
ncbi:MAG: RluA family pseudouridine synthase, partial [Clostridia bacterium]|nr:RluA family pseudouridine synthase [Clostridia bacterium]